MKTLIVLFALFLLSGSLLGQNQQKGTDFSGCVTDTNGQRIDYATILLEQNNQYAYGAITNTDGCFSLHVNPGQYTLIIQCLGYDSIRTSISVPTKQQLAYQLKPSAFALNEVVVKANTIEREADRFVMSVQPLSGKDGTELLTQAPGVWLTDDNISINGSSGTKVYVNDREIKLSGEELIIYLRSLKSENIRRIEVIPIAGAEFEAGTRGGVIKITLRQQQIDGYQGTVSMGGSFENQYQRYLPAASLQMHMKKWTISASGSGSFTPKEKSITDSERIYFTEEKQFTDHATSNLNMRYGTGRGGIIFELDSINSFGAEAEYTQRRNTDLSNNTTAFQQSGQTIKSNSRYDNRYENSTFSSTINYVRKTDDQGSVLKAIVDYDSKCSTGDNNYYTKQYIHAYEHDSTYRYHSHGNYNIINTDFSYMKVFRPTLKLNSGLKYTNTYMKSNSGYEALNSDLLWEEKTGFNEFIRYKENILGGFTSLTANLKRWDFTAGFRIEYTHTADLSANIKRDYVDFFPNLNVSYSFDPFKRWMVIGQLGRSIERPAFYALNPNRIQTSDYSYSIGNPYLKPMYVNRLSGTLVFNYRYILSIGGNLQHDLIREYVKQDVTDPNISFLTYENHYRENHWYIYVSTPFQPFNWLNTTFDFTGVKQDIKMTKGEKYQHHYLAFINATAAFTLPAGFSTEVQYNGMSRLYSGNCEVMPRHIINIFIRKKFMNNKLLLTANIYNLFDRQYSFANNMTDYRLNIRSERGSTGRNFRLTLTWNFNGGGKIGKNKIERSSASERDRLNEKE